MNPDTVPGPSPRQMTDAEREQVRARWKGGQTLRQIAAALAWDIGTDRHDARFADFFHQCGHAICVDVGPVRAEPA